MKKVSLSSGKAFAIVDDADFELVSQFNWSLSVCNRGKSYAHRRNKSSGGKMLMHRYIMGFGKKDGIHVDHINGDGLDNRRENMRICTAGENMRNYKNAWGKEGVRGIVKTRSGRFTARIRLNYKLYRIGTFDTLYDASVAYAFASSLMHGDFGSLPGHERFMEMQCEEDDGCDLPNHELKKTFGNVLDADSR